MKIKGIIDTIFDEIFCFLSVTFLGFVYYFSMDTGQCNLTTPALYTHRERERVTQSHTLTIHYTQKIHVRINR